MPSFNRYDICEAHYLFARHFHVGGDTAASDFERLNRIKYKPGLSLTKSDDPDEALTENGREIYRELAESERARWASATFEAEYILHGPGLSMEDKVELVRRRQGIELDEARRVTLRAHGLCPDCGGGDNVLEKDAFGGLMNAYHRCKP